VSDKIKYFISLLEEVSLTEKFDFSYLVPFIHIILTEVNLF